MKGKMTVWGDKPGETVEVEVKTKKTVVISIYVKGKYLCTARKDAPELPEWQEAFKDVAKLTLTEEGGIADYYKLDFYKRA